MADVINLNRYRKAKARALKEEQAAAKRARSGRTRVEKKAVQREQDRQAAELDGKQLADPEKAPPTTT